MTSIEHSIRTVFEQADARNWQAVEETFASKVLLDYTSMAGGEPLSLSPSEIITSWKTVLPGFESTHHQVGIFDIELKGDVAKANVHGLASHYLPNPAGDVWTTVGTYDFELAKIGDSWKITLMRFNLRKQDGNTQLATLAQQAVQQNKVQSKLALPAEDEALIHEFFQALEALDIKRFMRVWAENGQQIMPLSPESFPQELIGKNAIYNQYRSLPDAYSSMSFPRQIKSTSTPGLYIVCYQGIIPMNDGGTYNNIYVGYFSIENGKIQKFVEYFDPYILEAAFGKRLQENFNVKSAIAASKVSFVSEGAILTGNLYRPANFDENKSYPTVVVAGTWTSVKEQMANRYAAELARNGLIALSFDFRGYGESEGEPRNFENPEWKIQDIRNAVTYLYSLPETDKEELFGLGICAGAGYIVGAAARDERIAAISLVAPWLHNETLTHMIYGGEEGIAKLLQQSAKAKESYAADGTVEYVPAVSTTNPKAAMYGAFDFYLDPQRGAIPEWDGQFAVMAWEKWLNFDPVALASQVNVPALIVHSEDAAIPDGAKMFYQQLSGDKDSHWTSGSQFDFYDDQAKVSEAVNKTVEWFGQ